MLLARWMIVHVPVAVPVEGRDIALHATTWSGIDKRKDGATMAAQNAYRTIPEDIGQIPFDLIVIGAGINGAGIARDAALRGLKVLLVDKGDIASGTTDSSTRLIHGGLRYLEYYEVSLVRESLREREILLRIAPHLIQPLRFIIPIYKGWRRSPRIIRLGMIGYDILSFDRSLPGHEMLNRDEALTREPGLRPEGLLAAAVYSDAQVTFPERLTVENALSAGDHGALVLTYARVDQLLTEGRTVTGIRFTDLLNGGTHEARAAVTVNAAGPWVDQVLDGLEAHRMIGGTEGTHIVVDPFPGAPEEALYIEARADGRPYFIVPWNDHYLIGTTDIRYDGDLNNVRPTEEEIEYLIDETNFVIPRANLTRADVLYAFSGVRPLPYKEEGSTGAITRRHIIFDHAPSLEGLISIVGGKITTYRNLAEETVDRVYKKLGRPAPRCETARIPLPGANTADFTLFSDQFRASSGLDPKTADRLLHIYGIFAAKVLNIAEQDPALRKPLGSAPDSLAAEVVYAVRWERAQTLRDVLLRRTMLGLNPDVGLHEVEPAAEVARAHLGWDAARAAKEVDEYRQYVERFQPRALTATT